jgi:hypothetical protein
MIFHQMHYFVYCYAAFIVAFELGGRTAAVIIFLLNWIIYVVSPLLYSRAKDFRKVFLFGHSLLVILLAALYFAPSTEIKIILYLLTGIGGTTEFCIGKLAKKWDLYSEDAQNFSENFGHVFGVASCLMLFINWGELEINALFGAIFAMAAIACMVKTIITVKRSGL